MILLWGGVIDFDAKQPTASHFLFLNKPLTSKNMRSKLNIANLASAESPRLKFTPTIF
jgi:hypothetical protein